MNALTLDRLLLLLLLLLPGEEEGKADHPAKEGAEVMVMDMLHFHHQDLDIRVVVTLGQVLALATALMEPLGREMAVFSLKP